jgi:hypothetical protein
VDAIVDVLLADPEPAVRWRARTEVLGEAADSASVRRLRAEIRNSPLVARLLAGRDADGRLSVRPVYGKWQGAHWALAALADIGYPPGDGSLRPMRDQILDTWLHPDYFREFEADRKSAAYRGHGVAVMRGRHRRCASQQGNALRYLTVLGLCTGPAAGRLAALVERLLHWQWPDGGWNCDKRPEASMSSVAETLLPMRGLAAYAAATGDEAAGAAARRAAEVLLERHVVYRRSTGELIKAELAQLHWPLYWHYDVLGGLKGLAEVGVLADPRCARALELLAAKRLPDGGWPAERRYYRTSTEPALGNDNVDWGGTGKRRANPWVTLDALAVTRSAADHSAAMTK